MLKKQNPKVYTYIVSRDYGFAPNPFFGYCTLACCKQQMRKTVQKGDWILGLGSKKLKCRDNLIYIMKVTEILNFNDYFADPRFQVKKPDLKGSLTTIHGDNVYYTLKNGYFKQSECHHSHPTLDIKKANQKKDTSCDKVLISNHFFYFGDKFIPLSKELKDLTEKLRSSHMCKEEIQMPSMNFIKKIEKENEVNFIKGDPINWSDPFYQTQLEKYKYEV